MLGWRDDVSESTVLWLAYAAIKVIMKVAELLRQEEKGELCPQTYYQILEDRGDASFYLDISAFCSPTSSSTCPCAKVTLDTP